MSISPYFCQYFLAGIMKTVKINPAAGMHRYPFSTFFQDEGKCGPFHSVNDQALLYLSLKNFGRE